MNFFEAGIDILYYLMTLDKKIENKEILEIIQYLAHTGKKMRDNKENTYFLQQPDFTSLGLEIGMISSLNYEELKKRYRKAVSYYQENSTKAQKKELLKAALKLVKADGTVIKEEKDALHELAICLKKSRQRA